MADAQKLSNQLAVTGAVQAAVDSAAAWHTALRALPVGDVPWSSTNYTDPLSGNFDFGACRAYTVALAHGMAVEPLSHQCPSAFVVPRADTVERGQWNSALKSGPELKKLLDTKLDAVSKLTKARLAHARVPFLAGNSRPCDLLLAAYYMLHTTCYSRPLLCAIPRRVPWVACSLPRSLSKARMENLLGQPLKSAFIFAEDYAVPSHVGVVDFDALLQAISICTFILHATRCLRCVHIATPRYPPLPYRGGFAQREARPSGDWRMLSCDSERYFDDIRLLPFPN